MHRLAALLLCSLLVAVAAVAAPAPAHKPSKVWADGWDEPVDPVGGYRFDRDGDKLTITSPPRKGEDFDDKKVWRNAPRLLRGAEGDFTAQVRVTGDFSLDREDSQGVALRDRLGVLGAGLLVTDGRTDCQISRAVMSVGAEFDGCYGLARPSGGKEECFEEDAPPAGRTVYLMLERRADRLTMRTSPDGKKWTAIKVGVAFELARKVKVGVTAIAVDGVPFQAVFDEFKLKPLK